MFDVNGWPATRAALIATAAAALRVVRQQNPPGLLGRDVELLLDLLRERVATHGEGLAVDQTAQRRFTRQGRVGGAVIGLVADGQSIDRHRLGRDGGCQVRGLDQAVIAGIGSGQRGEPGAERQARGLRLNRWGLWLSTAYLLWSALAQQWVLHMARTSLQAQGLPVSQVLVTPAPFSTLLWRVVVMDGERFLEGHYALLDGRRPMRFVAFSSGAALREAHADHPQIQRLTRFADGFVKLQQQGPSLLITDLRMGQEPDYVFSFDIGPALAPGATPAAAQQQPARMAIGPGLRWLGRRMLGQDLDPPGR